MSFGRDRPKWESDFAASTENRGDFAGRTKSDDPRGAWRFRATAPQGMRRGA